VTRFASSPRRARDRAARRQAALPRGAWRHLTPGEIRMVRTVFGAALDCARVRVWRRTFLPGRPRGEAMAPNGHVYFHPDDYRDDFSRAKLSTRAWRIHELTHVLQHQQGCNVLVRAALDRRYRYLPLRDGCGFTSYGLEQQADIVRDYYCLLEGASVPGAPSIEAYRQLLPFASPM
jgi:hypothetical protein